MRLRVRPLAALAALLMLASCVTKVETVGPKPKTSARTMVNLSGTVTFRTGGALPDEAEVTVEAFDASRSGSPAISQSRWNTAGAQAPLPFTLMIDQAWVQRGKRIAIRATIKVGGAILYYSSAPYVIDGGIPPIPLEIVVVPPAR